MAMFSAMILGGLAFIATNIDDLFILAALFAQENSASGRRYIVAGQFLGISAIIAVSLVGTLSSVMVPKEWFGVLGIVPVYMGVKKFCFRDEGKEERKLLVLLAPYTYKVAAITIANAADNFTVYIPMFAHTSLINRAAVISVFLTLTFVWCCVAYIMVGNALVRSWVEKHGQTLIPLVLIGLGGYIMWSNHTLGMLTKVIFKK